MAEPLPPEAMRDGRVLRNDWRDLEDPTCSPDQGPGPDRGWSSTPASAATVVAIP